MSEYDDRLEAFRALVERQQAERFRREYPNAERNGLTPPVARIVKGKAWDKVDVGVPCNMSGKYMVIADISKLKIKAACLLQPWSIWTIRGYGVPHSPVVAKDAEGKLVTCTLKNFESLYWGGYGPSVPR